MPIEFATIPLDRLIGEHTLDAVDIFVEKIARKYYGEELEDANMIRFRLDGVVYTSVEDPDDGYRSRMDRLFVTLDVKMKNVFSPVKVVVRKKLPDFNMNDTLEFIDIKNGKTILEVGTDNTDDYYPYFVAAFTPENMAVNEKANG